MKKNLSTRERAVSNMIELDARLEILQALKNHEQEKFKRKVLQDFDRKIERVKDEIEMNKSLGKHGWIYVKMWSRDCDMYERTSVCKFQSIKEYYKSMDRFGEGLEGPGSFHYISKDEYDEERREPTRSRDRIMEAYENGRGTSIYV